MQHISLRACFVFLPFRILDGIVRRPLLYGRDLLQPLHQMLIVDHVLRLRRRVRHVVRVLPANPANGGATHGNAAAASSTRPVVRRPHEAPSRAGDGGKAAAGRRDAAAAEGLLLLLQLKVGQLQRLLNRGRHCLCHLGL